MSPSYAAKQEEYRARKAAAREAKRLERIKQVGDGDRDATLIFDPNGSFKANDQLIIAIRSRNDEVNE